LKIDPAAATKWLNGTSLPPDQKQELINNASKEDDEVNAPAPFPVPFVR
jgi:hypothetical protein